MGIGNIMNQPRGGYAMPLGPGYQNMAANQAGLESLLAGFQAIQQGQKQRAESQLLERLGGVSDRAGLQEVLAQTASDRGGGGIMGGILNAVNPFGSYRGMTGMERNMRGSLLGPLLEDPLQRQMLQERLTGAQLGNQAAQFGVGRLPTEAGQRDERYDYDRTVTRPMQNLLGQERLTGAQLANQAAQFGVGRLPTEAGQRDDLYQKAQEDRTRELLEHEENLKHQRWQRGRGYKRQGVDEKVQDQQIQLNQQKLEAGDIALKEARTPRQVGPDYKRVDSLVKADSQLAKIEEGLVWIEGDLTPQEAIRLQKVREQREAMRVQMGESLGVGGRPITPVDMLGRYRFHDPGLFGKTRLEINVGGGAEGEKWNKAGDDQSVEFYQIMEQFAGSLDQVDPNQADALRQILADGDPVKIQHAMDLIMRLTRNGQ